MASGKFLQSIHVGNKDILHTTILEFGHYLQPELAILGLAIQIPSNSFSPDRLIPRETFTDYITMYGSVDTITF